MEQKGFVKRVGLLLCLVLVVLIVENAYADMRDGVRYDYISSVAARLSIDGGTAKASGRIIPLGNRKTSIIVRLQRETSPGMWTTIAYWTGSNAAGSSEASGTHTISSGYNYRVYTVGKVYDSSGSVIETGTAYSSVHYY